MSRRVWAASLSAMVALVLTACGSTGSSGGNSDGASDQVVIAFFAPLTGPVAGTAKEMVNAAKLAVSQVNAEGGVAGSTVALKTYDTRGTADETTRVAKRALTVDGAEVFLGGYSSTEGLALRGVAERNEVVYINPSAGSPAITEDAKYSYTLASAATDYASVDARIVKNLGLTRPAILHDDGPYGKNITPVMKEALKEAGINLDGRTVGYQVGSKSMSTPINELKSGSPDVVLFAGASPADAGLVVKTMAEVGVKAPLIGLSVVSLPDAIRVGRDGYDQIDVYSTVNKDVSKSQYNDYVDAYVNEFGGDQDTAVTLSDASAQSYDAAKLIFQAMTATEGDTNADNLATALEELPPYTGASGKAGVKITFADSHQGYPEPPLLAYKVVDGLPTLQQGLTD